MKLYYTRRYTVEAVELTKDVLDSADARRELAIIREGGTDFCVDTPGLPPVFYDDYLVRVGDNESFVLSPEQFHALFSERAS